MSDHAARARAFADAMANASRADGAVRGLDKPLSNLFRDREVKERGLPAGELVHVLAVDPEGGRAEVEGMIPYDAFLDRTLAHGVAPCVVPQLKSITVGGAVAGIGIEATSFRHGLVHQTVVEMDVALPDGRIVTCSADNEHRDLFLGLPNSYGTLGYATRLVVETMPVEPYVEVTRQRFSGMAAFFDAVRESFDAEADFLDGVAFAQDNLVLSTGRFVAAAPYTSDYTDERIFYRSLESRATDYLTTQDYFWRWDTDWFWCSKNLGAQNALVRRLLGPRRLNSRFYQKVMRWNSRWRLLEGVERLGGYRRESVIQDVDLPMETAAEFLDWFVREVGVLPIWICPVRDRTGQAATPLFPAPAERYVNFGFWDTLRFSVGYPPGHFNRKLERAVADLGGIKSLYSSSFYDQEEFDRIYGGASYRELKRRYDPSGALGDLYAKCVRER